MDNQFPSFSAPSTSTAPSQATDIPSVRLISATPSAVGLSYAGNGLPLNSLETSPVSASPSVIAPKFDAPTRKRLVPKKSKLGLLGHGLKQKSNDFSDVVRRIGADTSSASTHGDFEIYVDPMDDPELGDILVVKKQKSRGALNGMTWGPLGEVTNVPSIPRAGPVPSATLKAKDEEKKWWSIGRGRRDSKEKEKAGKENYKRSKSPESPVRSKTPEPFKLHKNVGVRARFNSLDTNVLFGHSTNMGIPAEKDLTTSDSEPATRPSKNAQRSSTPESLKEACRAQFSKPVSNNTPFPQDGYSVPPNRAIPSQSKEQDSIALRAIRSVKSLARMGSWAPSLNEHGVKDRAIKQKRVKEKKEKVKEKEKKDKDKTEKGEKKKTRKDKKERKERQEKQDGTIQNKDSVEKVDRWSTKEDERTAGLSTSSFEAGGLSISPDPIIKPTSQILGKKKHSILSLGLPASIRLPSTRSGSTGSSTFQSSHLSVEGSIGARAKERIGSTVTISSASSLRPISVVSNSGASASTRESRGSVKWDEEGIMCVKREIQREKKEKRKKEKEDGRDGSDGKSRISITEIFPEIASSQAREEKDANQDIHRRFSTAFPIVTIEEATADGHCNDSDDIDDSLVYGGIVRLDEKESEDVQTTPVKRQRARPMSEQMLGRTRPRPVYEDDEGVLSILDAATNDLAQLINNLDLEATPTTPDLPPLRPLPLPISALNSTKSHTKINSNHQVKAQFRNSTPVDDRSPSTIRCKKSEALTNAASITSLRPYAQSRGSATRTLTTPIFTSSSINDVTIKKKSNEVNIGRPIAPWPVLLQQISPEKEHIPTNTCEKENDIPTPSKAGTWKKGHKRTITPAPEPEPAPVFHPLRPPKSRTVTVSDVADGKTAHKTPTSPILISSVNTSRNNTTEGPAPPPPSLGQKASAFLRKRCSLLPNAASGEVHSRSSPQSGPEPEKQKRNWMPQTLGGADGSSYAALNIAASEPNSDIPDELQVILKANGERYDEDDTFDFRRFAPEDSDDRDVERPRSLLPPLDFLDLPSELLNAPIFNTSLADEYDREHGDIDIDDTKKSFDFTGELQKLNGSTSNRHSFAEQLERAFMTPATVDLRCDFGGGLLSVEVPPVPHLPVDVDVRGVTSNPPLNSAEENSLAFRSCTRLQHKSLDGNDSEPEAFDPQMVSKMFQGPRLRAEPLDAEAHILRSKGSTTVDINNLPELVGHLQNEMTSTSLEANFTDRIGRIIVSPDYSQASGISAPPNPSGPRFSDGELNTAFKFGGLHYTESPEQARRPREPLTLSDIIPPSSQVCPSSRPQSALLEDDSLFQSIFKAPDVPQPRPRATSDASQKFLQARNSIYRHSHASSVNSFSGFDSFDEVRRGFEFNSLRPAFYPPPTFNHRDISHNRDSVLSIASVSSYGRVINPGVPDPFDFGSTSLQERQFPDDFTTTSFSIDDTFSFLNHGSRRRRVDSDASSFYFRAHPGDRRRESGLSFTSQAPPVSLYNRGFGGNINARSAWRRSAHRFNSSVDSIMSDFSAMRLGRPGIGDKMFEMADQVMPLAPISGSPGNNPDTSPQARVSLQSTYDSIIDDDGRASADISDSIFDKTDQDQHTSSSELSVFGHDEISCAQSGLLPPHQFRPLSFMSMASVHSPAKDDDTMITMFDGGYVRRLSMGSILQASPCVRVEKRKHAVLQGCQGELNEQESPKKAKVVVESPVPTRQPGEQCRSPCQGGLLGRGGLEESCFVGNGEDTSISFRPVPVFTRPVPASRSRSSTCTSSFGGDTPPLSPSDGSSISGSSLSSFDLSEVNAMLPNTVHLGRPRTRARPRGHGHRRRYSHVRSSRTESVYETIEEEVPIMATSSVRPLLDEKISGHTQTQPVFIVESDAASINSSTEELTTLWNDERGVMALRKYYALHDEVQSAVTESKRVWVDTPFSIFAVQSFKPPHHPEGMKALLESSLRNYGPLPSELRPRRMRSRKDSRPSPYPHTRPLKFTSPAEFAEPPLDTAAPSFISLAHQSVFSKDLSAADVASEMPTKALSSIILNIERENSSEITPLEGIIKRRDDSDVRPTVLSRTKRNVGLRASAILAPTGSKRNGGANTTSMDQKENVTGTGSIVTPMGTLRLNRPRPKGRPVPASASEKTQRPIRV